MYAMHGARGGLFSPTRSAPTRDLLDARGQRDRVGLRGEVKVFAGDATRVVRRERERDAAVPNQDVWVMLDRFGVGGDLIHKRHRGDKVAESIGALDFFAGLRPLGKRLEFRGDLGVGEFDKRHGIAKCTDATRLPPSRRVRCQNRVCRRIATPLARPSAVKLDPNRPRATRLAPTPSGALHVGNARTFLLNWALARHEGWRITLRLEDLDIGRVKDGAHATAIADLADLGLDWDGDVEVQSRDLSPYRAMLERLAKSGELFRCDRSRSEIRSAASAPHLEDGETRYPPELRPPEPWPRAIQAWEANHRLRVDPREERVFDELLGERTFNPGLEAGDLVVWTKLGVPAYQLAVVVDDARHGITDVVRGDDLLASAARQQLLARLLELPHARWWHLPLVYGDDGKRLAKRHGAHSLRALFERGVKRERIAGWAAWSMGLVPERAPLSLDALVAATSPDALRATISARNAQSCVFGDADLAWLCGD